MGDLTGHRRSPDLLLDPNSVNRNNEVDRLRDASYVLSLTSEGNPQFTGPGTANIPVRVRFKTANEELDTSSEAHFVLRGTTWYFSDFRFLAFPNALIVVLVVGCLIGVFYAASMLILRSRLLRSGQLNFKTQTKLFVPFFWPSLFKSTQERRAT
ncbi:hypothetical protein [Edaphobacter aggregans]|nr:hypothetical protein [Edaphobacter aggregans]